MKVYRVERDDTRIGPYWEQGMNWNLRHSEGTGHPSPYNDGLSDFAGYYKFGFISLSQAIEWFKLSGFEKLEEKGFSLCEFDCPNTLVKVGGKQCAFQRDHSLCLLQRKIPVTEIKDRAQHLSQLV